MWFWEVRFNRTTMHFLIALKLLECNLVQCSTHCAGEEDRERRNVLPGTERKKDRFNECAYCIYILKLFHDEHKLLGWNNYYENIYIVLIYRPVKFHFLRVILLYFIRIFKLLRVHDFGIIYSCESYPPQMNY